ncbi:mitochondrial ATP synthase epsilon chain-domain-containing protein [Yarrowia lipolytica]|uniref:Mitochondrial ATP synthase epsilon chain-domain-containing protein n=1 Tax=Yarrowia lipolytica TaxID=4952 RepID=A0A371CFI7_YARLL|nr:mitochondrial ATP synthase epsilon chain-domain-containing protein [Yarrowia lipolytica]KAE8174559.1 mitochondrial ATP synthase epsilon chain-domain-containing protein [Yarrowia lipolytica]KAJ8056365.1 mitochondrial ATP synthase epsilon chain-domain-containing protein [Yarrowia lipolytica]QNQ00430.1 Hypothetical protein YALI2_E01745g [Yarrowia lipolytica]RDW29047.1 mitochondrial ATP synthase epsilon chain-domain-containing protein [Yarrowia lipolytica]
MSAWKSAGFSFNKYSAIAARTVRKALTEQKRAHVNARDLSEIKVAKWESGKQGDVKIYKK